LKKEIDNLYENNLIGETDKFEDTIWCNDRSLNGGAYSETFTGVTGSTAPNFFKAFQRIQAGNPTLECERPDDRFTVDAANGNGKLDYPVATITADEAMLAGHSSVCSFMSCNGTTPKTSYLTGYYYEQPFWTLTPFYGNTIGYGATAEGPYMLYVGSGQTATFNADQTWTDNGIRPMVSFKYDTYVKSGNGTATNPYILEW
jgi:hypothetical protein